MDKQIIYRKHLGLVGFNLALLHGTISLFFLPNNFEFLNYYLAPGNRLPFILALISLLILMTMTLASNNPSIKSMGAKKWKILMRFGFVALLFALTHFTLKKYSSWFEWNFSDHNYLPPLSLIVFVLGLFSLLLRISLYFNKINKEKKH
ncbi:MAG: ferric reductase-like transmembrane domain-containing protein [bacterium]